MSDLKRNRGIVIGVVCCLPVLAVADEHTSAEHRRVIVVDGSGEVTASPDMAAITAGVTTEADSAQDAVRQNNDAMTALLKELQRHGIADKDIQTRNFNVAPRYRQDDGRRNDQPPKIVGYRVTNEVHVRVRKLPSLGQVLDGVIAAGANEIHDIRFSIDDSQDLMDEARRKAVVDARRKAEILADAAQVQLGHVLDIRETAGFQPSTHHSMAAAELRSVPIATGEQALSARVQMTFAISDRE